MYKYEYEKISCRFSNLETILGSNYNTTDFKRVIKKHMRNGERYVGFIPTKQGFFGRLKEIELVFEVVEEN